MNNKFYSPIPSLQVSQRLYKTSIDGLWYITHRTFYDNRGFYSESAVIDEIQKTTHIPFVIKQLNHSHSEKNVIRGFHKEAWEKLVTITMGIGFCALADIRPDSKTYKKIEIFILGRGKNALDGSLFITRGIANSVCVVEGPMDYIYGVNQLYTNRNKDDDRSISLFDKDLGVVWPTKKENMIISDRDKKGITLREIFPNKFK